MNSTFTHLSSVHLSSVQIDSVLMGASSAETTAHLASCGLCRLRFEEAAAPIARFRAVTLAWSERQSATMPLRASATGTMTWGRRAAMAGTASAVLLVGLTLRLTKNTATFTPTTPASHTVATSIAEVATVTAPALLAPMQRGLAAPKAAANDTSDEAQPGPQDEEIARDNQMLQNIDRALDNSVESPADAYALRPVNSSEPAREPAPTLQD